MTTTLAARPQADLDSPISDELRARAQRILDESYAYIDSPSLRDRRWLARLDDHDVEPALPSVAWYQPTGGGTAAETSGAFPKVMTADEERMMFLRFNHAKMQLSRLQRKARHGLTGDIAGQAIRWHRRYQHYRECIVRANLALVLGMARRMRMNNGDYAEVVSEGNMALLRAVDKFNVDRGFKFSTYACRAILKAFSRTAGKQRRYSLQFPVEFDPEMEHSDWNETQRVAAERDCVDDLKQIVDRNLAHLSDTEQTVIRRRFNWGQEAEDELTLDEVGRIIGVTKERVRQIQNRALAKIRAMMKNGTMDRPHIPENPWTGGGHDGYGAPGAPRWQSSY